MQEAREKAYTQELAHSSDWEPCEGPGVDDYCLNRVIALDDEGDEIDEEYDDELNGVPLSVRIRSGIPYFFISPSQTRSTSWWLKLFIAWQ